MYMARIEEEMKNKGIRGVTIGDSRVWSLAYADDILIIANNREPMQDMMGTLKKFVKKRNLELSVNKTKMLVFNRKRNEKYEKWLWGGKIIEEVQEFIYLGFMINNKDNYKEHIKKMRRKGRMEVRKVWGLGERICRNDFKRRWTLFRYLCRV